MGKEMRTAIELLAETGCSNAEAIRASGVSVSGFYKSLSLPQTKEYLENLSVWHISRLQDVKAASQIAAIQHGVFLMRHAKSETVQAKMVEFLARGLSEGDPPQMAVTINNAPSGYAYAPPGAEVVDITPRTDNQSSDASAQDAENEED